MSANGGRSVKVAFAVKLWPSALHEGLALVLDPGEAVVPGEPARAALTHHREALRLEPTSVVAAAGATRLGTALGDDDAAIAGALAHAELAPKMRERLVNRKLGLRGLDLMSPWREALAHYLRTDYSGYLSS